MKIMETDDVQLVGANSEMIFETLEDVQSFGEIVEIYVWNDDFS